jgi:5-methyltetrahydrofolate--homocysteine methyltransferase
MYERGGYTLIVGERINPTGRPGLAAALVEGRLDLALSEARAQAEAGADVIDVNVGAPGVDETALLPRLAREVAEATGLTVCVDSSDPAALREALAVLPAGTLVNSVTGDEESLAEVVPAAAGAGAVLIGMAKDRKGIPESVEGRLEIARRIVERAGAHGIGPERILVDFLTLPVATDPDSTRLTLECIRRSGDLGIGTILGASNVSFGMPTRHILNAAFLAMAVEAGLTAAIVNPLEPGVVQAILAADVLAGRDAHGRRFLGDYRKRRRGPEEGSGR